jgi:hypothetical protein
MSVIGVLIARTNSAAPKHKGIASSLTCGQLGSRSARCVS